MRLVLVDLDGTLLRAGSESRFIVHLFSIRRLGLAALLRSLVFALRHARRFGRHVWKKNKAYLSGLPTAEIVSLARSFAIQRLTPLLRSELRERLAVHRAAGDRILILTGSPDFLAAPLAEAIGADGCIATTCAQKEGRFLGNLPPCHPFGAEKLELARAAADRLGLGLADCIGYADSGEDIALLSAVGTAIAVSPDRRLARKARTEGWEILADSPPAPARRTLLRLGQRA